MRRFIAIGILTGALSLGMNNPAAAQDPGANLLSVGEMSPDFELVGATRHGILKDRVRLSDYRGDTVVLAFFYKVRTRG